MHLNSKNESRFIGVCSRNNLAKIKNGAYVINLDEYKSIETSLDVIYVTNDVTTYFDSFDEYKSIETSLDVIYVTNDVTTYFDSFGVHHIPKEIKKFTGNKIMKTSI